MNYYLSMRKKISKISLPIQSTIQSSSPMNKETISEKSLSNQSTLHSSSSMKKEQITPMEGKFKIITSRNSQNLIGSYILDDETQITQKSQQCKTTPFRDSKPTTAFPIGLQEPICSPLLMCQQTLTLYTPEIMEECEERLMNSYEKETIGKSFYGSSSPCSSSALSLLSIKNMFKKIPFPFKTKMISQYVHEEIYIKKTK
jgi:hypothetical protein